MIFSPGCGGDLTESYGDIESPNYPNSYNHNAECFYTITVSQGSKIKAFFSDMEMEPAIRGRCTYDYIEVN